MQEKCLRAREALLNDKALSGKHLLGGVINNMQHDHIQQTHAIKILSAGCNVLCKYIV